MRGEEPRYVSLDADFAVDAGLARKFRETQDLREGFEGGKTGLRRVSQAPLVQTYNTAQAAGFAAISGNASGSEVDRAASTA